MRKLLFGLLLTLSLVLAAPSRAAHAGFIVEGSLGKGAAVKPDVKAQPVNIMVAPGVTVLSMLRLQLGIVGDLPDVEESKADLGIRPMLTLSPPLFPLYGRVVFAFTNLLHEETRTFAYGGALGVGFSLAMLGVFAEVGLLPRSLNDTMIWVVEGRAGVSLTF